MRRPLSIMRADPKSGWIEVLYKVIGDGLRALSRARPGEKLSLEAMCVFLEAQKMAKQYFPERLEIVDEMPRTPSGKIQKFKLREMAKAFSV